jgi:hypothetical protein
LLRLSDHIGPVGALEAVGRDLPLAEQVGGFYRIVEREKHLDLLLERFSGTVSHTAG